jgi:hypothetical protein
MKNEMGGTSERMRETRNMYITMFLFKYFEWRDNLENLDVDERII